MGFAVVCLPCACAFCPHYSLRSCRDTSCCADPMCSTNKWTGGCWKERVIRCERLEICQGLPPTPHKNTQENAHEHTHKRRKGGSAVSAKDAETNGKMLLTLFQKPFIQHPTVCNNICGSSLRRILTPLCFGLSQRAPSPFFCSAAAFVCHASTSTSTSSTPSPSPLLPRFSRTHRTCKLLPLLLLPVL